MAGSGNLELLGRIEKQSSKINNETSFGNHMATHMALGILFMGILLIYIKVPANTR